ncbi:MAG: UDP-N-acetylglucosamine 1-carboxyvinyltransferase [Pseudomonadota bacterium]
MDKIIIEGGHRLSGTIPISGAKNAALPLMAAALLSDQPLTLTNLPRLADINTMMELLVGHGVSVTYEGAAGPGVKRRMTLTAGTITDTVAPYDIVRKMRASILVLGPLLAREGIARVSMPGGCAIGNRPIDLHLKGLERMGATIEMAEGYVEARTNGRLMGAQIGLPFASVGATENLMMAAVLARGTTRIENAAKEPEIVDLARCLNAMGARIGGAGRATIEVEGVESLSATTHQILADRIEAGSYAVAAAITGGDIHLEGAELAGMGAVVDRFREAGVQLSETETGVHVVLDGRPNALDIDTQPFPGFATDMQAQFMALLAVADGTSVIKESIFENRFMHVPELARMGAEIDVSGNTAIVRGVENLRGAPVMATDLRASMGLVLAGLAANGTTTVNRVYHLDRGYERLEEKLSLVGAKIERVGG